MTIMTFDKTRLARIVGVLIVHMAVIFGGLAVHASHGHAAEWQVVPGESRIGFSGTHAGRQFEGEFKTWSATIMFDPADLASAKADVKVDLSSAVTGDMTYDKTLPTPDWFNTAKFAEGRFVTTAFRALDGNKFEADGTLGLRGFEVPVTLAFTFEDADGGAVIVGTTRLKRLDFAIGQQSDAAGSWVSLDIPVDVRVVLKSPE